jgi:short-subunit dehydrogenase
MITAKTIAKKVKSNGKSTIVNMSLASSDYGVPELASYSASKFSVKALMEVLMEALELEWQKMGSECVMSRRQIRTGKSAYLMVCFIS